MFLLITRPLSAHACHASEGKVIKQIDHLAANRSTSDNLSGEKNSVITHCQLDLRSPPFIICFEI